MQAFYATRGERLGEGEVADNCCRPRLGRLPIRLNSPVVAIQDGSDAQPLYLLGKGAPEKFNARPSVNRTTVGRYHHATAATFNSNSLANGKVS